MKAIGGVWVIMALFMLVTGCSTKIIQSDMVAVYVDHDGALYVPSSNMGGKITDMKEVRFASELAILSNNVYCDRKDLSSSHCDNKTVLLQVPTGWTPAAVFTTEEPSTWYPRWRSRGMRVEGWKKKTENGTELAAIVFRGTNFEEIDDWYSNLRWITRFNPFVYDQYDQVRYNIGKMIDQLSGNDPKVKIVTTGHSLGGGLAQQAAYASNRIKEVYAFDSSPVTGYFSVSSEARTVNEQGISIYRIYEIGEVLGYFRGFIRNLSSIPASNPRIMELGFNYDRGSAVAQHSIEHLALGMSKTFIGQQPQYAFGKTATGTEVVSMKAGEQRAQESSKAAAAK